MYRWRQLTDEERSSVPDERRGRKLPWHSPPHLEFDGAGTFLITAACYEHAHVIGSDAVRIAEFEEILLATTAEIGARVYAWCVLPNHYHVLVRVEVIKLLRVAVGQMHGRTSRYWNKADNALGRKVWFNFFDRPMRSTRHFWATMNYVHNNAVHHRYVTRWQDWPYSSAHKFLDDVGRDEAQRIWTEFPILDYGKDWDVY
jgi:putative transposase